MYRLELSTDTFKYRDEQVGGVCPGLHDPLVPPSDFCDRITDIKTIWMTNQKNPFSAQTLGMLAVMQTTNGPGAFGGASWDVVVGFWDAEFGNWLGRQRNGSIAWLTQTFATASRSGEMFSVDSLSPHWVTRYTPDLAVVELIHPTHWGDGSGNRHYAGAYDPQNNIAVAQIGNIDPADGVGIYEWTSGDRIGEVRTPGIPKAVFWGPRDTAYVVSDEGLLTVVNYATQRVIGVSRLFGTAGIVGQVYAYDDFRKRLLFSELSPEAADGASNIVIKGYHPVPIAVSLAPPIPIQAPKLNRTVQVMTRSYGDAGEGITGVTINQTPTGPGITTPQSLSSDGLGFAKFNCACDAIGGQQTDVQATV